MKFCATWVFLGALSFSGVASAGPVSEVRGLLAGGQWAEARQWIERERAQAGVHPELLEAMSWIARGDLARKDYDAAERYAEQTYALLQPLLQTQKIDADRHLPIALGAVIEVQAQAMAARGENGPAVALLRREIAKYEGTSIVMRLQKNLNLLTLEGKPAPEVDVQSYWGPRPPRLSALRGKTVLLFFWADWCGDCKAQAPTIAQLQSRFATSGLVVLAPTQLYGVELGKNDAPPAEDVQRVQAVWHGAYAPLAGTPVPLSAGNFRRYGASTVPTLVLISPKGEVVMYHPGRMSYDQLATRVTATLRTPPAKK